jgi:hypothetical protein
MQQTGGCVGKLNVADINAIRHLSPANLWTTCPVSALTGIFTQSQVQYKIYPDLVQSNILIIISYETYL